jgi:hypothetical protein
MEIVNSVVSIGTNLVVGVVNVGLSVVHTAITVVTTIVK